MAVDMHLPTTTYVPYEFNDKVKGDRSVPKGTTITECKAIGRATESHQRSTSVAGKRVRRRRLVLQRACPGSRLQTRTVCTWVLSLELFDLRLVIGLPTEL